MRLLNKRSTSTLLLASACLFQAHAAALPDYEKEIKPVLVEYCYDCHGDGMDKGGLAMDDFKTLDQHFSNHEMWLAVWENLRAQMMPPSRKPQPTPEQRDLVSRWIERKIFKVDPENPDPGRVTIRRLNRTQYRYAVKDLLDVDFQVADAFPPDDTGYGFDTIGDVLSISPLLMEKYVDAAREVVKDGIHTSGPYIPTTTIWGSSFRTSDNKREARNLSFSEEVTTYRTEKVAHPGDYEIAIQFESRGSREATSHTAQMELFVNGKEVIEKHLGWENGAIWVKGNARLNEGENRMELRLHPKEAPLEGENKLSLYVHRVNLRGPLDGSHTVYPKNYYDIFTDGPASDKPTERVAYAEKILKPIATRAFRRPVEKATLDRLVTMALKTAEQPGQTFEKGIGHAVTAILASPRFLFRAEIQPEPNNPGKVVPVDQYALASRLSFFLWNSIPDEELLKLAGEGRLREQLRPQVDRMMKDGRSKRFIRDFVGQWLSTRDVDTTPIDPRRILGIRDSGEAYKIYNSRVKQAMEAETEMFFEHLVRENRPAHEFLDADYTFLNKYLARFYGIEGVNDDKMVKVQLKPEDHRGGILTHGSMHVVTSNPTRTSPVKRGLFVLENLLGTPAPPAPPNVPQLEEAAKGKNKRELTMRELMEIHREEPLCASCHARMDPLGLALESFNAIGMWRAEENGKAIDPAGQLITGEKFGNIRELSKVLANERRRDFYRCLTEKMLTYAIGRGMEYYDMPTIDGIVKDLEKENGAMRTLLYSVIESAPFQKRRGDGDRLLAESHN